MSVFELPKTPPATGDLYERDFYSWALEQAALVREGRFDAIDRANIVEELESLGREQFSKLTSALRVLMMHMLKWDHQPERRSRSWLVTIVTQRDEFADVLTDNPGLKPRLDEAIERAYRRARREAAAETGLKIDLFPAKCPYEFNDLTQRPFDLDASE
jgi:predicted DNA-binding ribbon-helix-helix protein